MTSFLREAFGLVTYPFHKLQQLYDTAGYYVWQAAMNDRFLAISPAAFESRPLQKAIMAYDWALPRMRHAVVDGLSVRNAQGDYGPKPDIKPALIRMGETCLMHASKNPVMIGALLFTFGLAAAYAMTHGAGTAVPDMMGTIYGASPHNPRPRN